MAKSYLAHLKDIENVQKIMPSNRMQKPAVRKPGFFDNLKGAAGRFIQRLKRK